MQIINKFSRGEIDDLLVTREEVPKIQDSASLIENWELLRFGAMRFRNGTESLGAASSDSYFVPFVYAIDDTADLEFTGTELKIWVDDEVLSNDSLSTVGAITDESDASGSATIAGNVVTLQNGNSEEGIGRVDLASTSNKYLQFLVEDGPIHIKSDSIDTVLNVGLHKLKIIDSSIKIESKTIYAVKVTISGVAVGTVSFPITISNPSSLRSKASRDIVYFAHSDGIFQVERRGETSWSLVETRIDDGIFGVINDSIIKLSTDALNGDAVLTSTSDFFNSNSVGKLFKLGSAGQKVTAVTESNDFGTESIRLTGAGTNRTIAFSVVIGESDGSTTTTVTDNLEDPPIRTTTIDYLNGSEKIITETIIIDPNNEDPNVLNTVTKITNADGEITTDTTTIEISYSTFTGTYGGQTISGSTVRLQRSSDESGWEDIEILTSTASGQRVDDLDNSITFYRLYVGAGDNDLDQEITLNLSTTSGSKEGICRVKSYIDETSVNVQILSSMGGTDETSDWYESIWGAANYPNVVDLYESRLHYAGLGKFWSSLPDAFDSFDESLEGDSRAISKTVGFGASDKPNWLSSTTRMVMGIPTDEISIRSDNFGTLLTQANVKLVGGGNNGSAPIDCDKIDDDIIFVHRSLKKILAISHNIQTDKYEPDNFMSFNQQICEAGIKRIAVVREPETRVYVVLNNGEMRVLLYDKTENIRGWYRFVTDGLVKDIIVTPSTDEDTIKIVVERGSIYYYEKLSRTDSGNYVDCLGGTESSYIAKYKSGKIGYISKHSTLTERARIFAIGFIGKGYIRSITYGNSFDKLKKFGERFKGKVQTLDINYTEYDEVKLDFNGKIEPDSRVYLQATKPCTIMAITYDVKESDNPLKKDK